MREVLDKFLQDYIPDYKSRHFLLAVSGGLDSRVMAHIFHEMGISFSIAHCNFQLRAVESDQDHEFVENLAIKYEVKFYAQRFDTKSYAIEHNLSIQMAARKLRYDWFEETRVSSGSDFICTAHHLNDTVETSLFNMVKGTGFKGLAGIPPFRDRFFRPMLTFSKDEILKLANSKSLTWREDASNQSDDYRRNFLRSHAIPLLKEVNPSFPENSGYTMSRIRGANSILRKHLVNILMELVTNSADSEQLNVQSLLEFEYEEQIVLLDFWLNNKGFTGSQVRDIIKGLHSDSGIQFLSGDYFLSKDRKNLILTEKIDGDIGEKLIESSEEFNDGPNSYICHNVSAQDFAIIKDPALVQLDYEKLTFPLKLRSWKDGDWFIPLGMKGKKKISDFMIDHKIPVNFKRQFKVLESAGDIVALPGWRIDDRFKVTNQTSRVFLMEISHEESI